MKAVQSLDPAGVGARDLRECLLLQLESRNGRDGVAWQIVTNHLKLVETRDYRELSKVLGRPAEHIEIAIAAIRRLNPRPGLRYSGAGARIVEPDVHIFKDGDDRSRTRESASRSRSSARSSTNSYKRTVRPRGNSGLHGAGVVDLEEPGGADGRAHRRHGGPEAWARRFGSRCAWRSTAPKRPRPVRRNRSRFAKEPGGCCWRRTIR